MAQKYYNLLTAGFASMVLSAVVLAFQAEFLLVFGAIVMALVCYDERNNCDV